MGWIACRVRRQHLQQRWRHVVHGLPLRNHQQRWRRLLHLPSWLPSDRRYLHRSVAPPRAGLRPWNPVADDDPHRRAACSCSMYQPARLAPSARRVRRALVRRRPSHLRRSRPCTGLPRTALDVPGAIDGRLLRWLVQWLGRDDMHVLPQQQLQHGRVGHVHMQWRL